MSLYLFLFFLFILMLSFCFRFKNFMKAFLVGSFSGGVFYLTAAYFFAQYISFSIFTLLVALITGIPGVLTVMIFNYFVA